MLSYTARRLTMFLPMVLGIVVMTFALVSLLPGDAAILLLGPDASLEAVNQLRDLLRLDAPWYQRLWGYLGDLSRGDLGVSVFQGEPVTTVIAGRLGATVELALVALAFASVLGVTLGIWAAVRRGSAVDRGTLLFSQLGVSMPVFWLGILLMLLFAVTLGWLPSIGRGEPLGVALAQTMAGRPGVLVDSLAHLTLPALTLGLSGAAVISRLSRAAMVETLEQDFVRTARAKGLPPIRVIWIHALKNALLPILSLIGLRFGALLGGAVLTEGIFGWPGMGQLAVSAISQRDLPLIQGVVLTFALLFALVNLATDLLYAVVDPRVRLT